MHRQEGEDENEPSSQPADPRLLLWFLLSLFLDRFLKVHNAINGFRQAMIKGIMADAVTFLILAAGIALLIGPSMAPEGALAAGVAVQQGFGTIAGIAVAHVMLRCTRFGW